ncbi:MAG: CNNM domain-containing protein, partial [Armatimonadota bacterium]
MPDPLKSVALVLFALFLVLLNGFFVAAEFAIVKVRSTRIDELAAKNQFGAKKAQDAVRHLDAYLSATQLGITLASLGLGYVGEPAFAHLIEPIFGSLSETTRHILSAAIAFTLITALHIVIGELAPKSLAIQRAESTTLAIIYPLDFFYRLFKLPIALLNGTASLVLRPFGLTAAGEHGGDAHSEDELRLILNASMAGGEIKASEVHLVNQV